MREASLVAADSFGWSLFLIGHIHSVSLCARWGLARRRRVRAARVGSRPLSATPLPASITDVVVTYSGCRHLPATRRRPVHSHRLDPGGAALDRPVGATGGTGAPSSPGRSARALHRVMTTVSVMTISVMSDGGGIRGISDDHISDV